MNAVAKPAKKPAPMRERKDPFESLSTELIQAALVAKGWPVESLGRAAGAPAIVLGGELLAVVTVGHDGEAALDKVCGAHGTLPRTPELDVWGGASEQRCIRLYRVPAGAPIPTAENLHGQCGGVTILTSGTLPLPPRHGDSGVYAHWSAAHHPALQKLGELPQWLADAARDPAAAARLATTVRPTRSTAVELDAWARELTMERGRPASTHGNLCIIFRRSPAWAGRFAFSEMSQSPTLDGRALADGDIGRIRERLELDHKMTPGEALVRGAALTVAEERKVHPVRDFLLGLRWDGVPRLDHVASDILGSVDEGASLMVRRWFVSLVARGLRPGCKVDTALVLVGLQGARKSSFFEVIGGEFFTDSHVDLTSKDVFLQLAEAWILELAEIDGITSRREVEEIKAFLSSKVDRFRPPYGRSVIKSPRHCVVVGSTNRTTFLEDDTGSRRFWCVNVGAIDLELLRAEREQLLAEAVAAFDAGEPWWLDAAEDVEREERAEQHQVEDPWSGPVSRWLAKQDRHDHTSEEILSGALDVPRKDQTKGAAMRLSRVLGRLGGWERRKGRPLRDGVRQAPAWLWMGPEPEQPGMGFLDPTEEFPP